MIKVYKIIILNIIWYMYQIWSPREEYYCSDRSKEAKMGRAYGRHRNMTLTNGRTILKWILEKDNGGGGGTRIIWRRIGTTGGLL
jgi:hypothetical protein